MSSNNLKKDEVIKNLTILLDRWEDDENMYSSTMNIDVDKEFIDTIYSAIKLLKGI